jgi:hypothetical protein
MLYRRSVRMVDATSSDVWPRARSFTTTSTSPASNVSNDRPNPLLPRRRAFRSGVLEVEDPNAEASQVVPLLDDRRYVVTGDDEPHQ